jgi:hypothetical protein
VSRDRNEILLQAQGGSRRLVPPDTRREPSLSCSLYLARRDCAVMPLRVDGDRHQHRIYAALAIV